MPIIQTDKKLRKRSPRDFYPTPYGLADAVVERLAYSFRYTDRPHVLDPGYGTGVWGKAVDEHFPNARITGVDIHANMDVLDSPIYGLLYHMDYLDYASKPDNWDQYDLIIGNPPYTLAEEFIRASIKLLKYSGMVAFLLRNSFLHSQKRYHGLYNDHPLNNVYFLSRRPSFTGDGKTDADDYIIAIWAKMPMSRYFLGEHLMWDYAEEDLK